MDPIENQRLLDAAKFEKYPFLRRAFHVVISVSLLSLFFFYYPGVFFFPYSLAHPLERKYMFLICNGILAFLAKSSGSCSYSYSDDKVLGGKFSALPNFSDTKLAAVEVVSEDQPLSLESSIIMSPIVEEEAGEAQETIEDQEPVELEADQEQEEQGNYDQLHQDYYEDNSEALSSTSNDLDHEEGKHRLSSKQEGAGEIKEATESTADEELGISNDELNKKFEDFIRKMKEELRIQAQQQLITV